MRAQKIFLLFITVVCFLMTLSGTDALAAEKIFKLGVLGPQTGPAALTGTEMKLAAAMAFEKIGNKIGDYKIELIYIDDQSDAAKSTNAYSEAIERLGVQAGISNWNTAVSVAIQPILAKYKVPHFFVEGAGKAVNDKWFTYPPEERYLIMKGWPIPQKLVAGYADCINNAVEKNIWKPGKKVLALWGEDTDFGRSFAKGMKDLMIPKGWQIFTEEYFILGQTEFYPFLNKCKQAGVTVLAGNSSSTASMSSLVKQYREVGIKGFLCADGLGYVGNWYELTGPASDGVLDMLPQISTPAQKVWAAEYKAKYGTDPSPSAAGMAYDYANFFIKVAKRTIEKYGKLDSQGLFEIGRAEVVTGKLVYDSKDGALFHKRYRCNAQSEPDPVISPDDFYFPVVQFKGGKTNVVWPGHLKTADLLVPK